MAGTKTAKPKRGKDKAEFRRMDLGAADRAAAKFVQGVYQLPSFTAAVRVCLRQQALRDKVLGAPKAEADDPDGTAAKLLVGGTPTLKVYRPLTGGLEKDGVVTTGADLKPRLLRFWESDEASLRAVQAGWGMTQMVDAVRFAIRVQATLAGYPLPEQDW